MSLLRTVFAVGLISLATLLIGPPLMALELLTMRRWHRTDRLTRLWSRIAVFAAGAHVSVRGLEHLPRDAHFVFVSNHQSHLDVPTIVGVLPQKVRFVAKRSLFFVPVFGQVIWLAGHIAVDRAAPGSAQDQLAEARRLVGRVLSVLFFAEGTRSPDGTLLPFKKGAATLALETGVPILPLAVSGTREVLPKGFSLFRGGPVGVAIGRPIPVAGRTLDDREALTAEVRAAVEALLPEAEAARRERG